MTEPAPILYSGRRFSPEELVLMRQAATDYASLGITEIARTICEWLDWKRPNGRLKNHECRLLLERLDHQGILKLPPLRRSGHRGQLEHDRVQADGIRQVFSRHQVRDQ